MEQIINQGTAAILRENELLKEENRKLKSKLQGLIGEADTEPYFGPVADTLPLMLWFLSPEGKIIFYNRKWKNYTGMPADQWRMALHPEDKRKVSVSWAKAYRQGNFLETEARLLRSADNTFRWHLIRIHPQYEANGQLIRWIATAVDIDDHMRLLNKQALVSQFLEESIRYRTLQLNEAQAIAHVGSWEWDILKNEINFSDEMYRIYGFQPAEININNEIFYSFLHPDSKAKVKEAIENACKNNKPYRFTHRIIRKDGEVRTIETRGRIVTNQSGQAVKMSGTGQDITELITKENKLREAKELSENIISHSVDGINVFDKDLRYIVWNDTIAKFTGIKPEDAIGKSIYEVFSGVEGSEFETAFIKVLNGEKIYFNERKFNIGNGYYESHSLPMRNANGEVIGGINIVHDITERKSAEEQLLEKNNELIRSNRELEQFAYVASHDLKEPLRMISSYTQLLRKRYKDKLDSQAEEFIDFAMDGANRMSHLINDLLEYSRIGRLNTASQEIDCNDIIEIVKKNLQNQLENSGGSIVISNELPVIKSSYTYMVQLFQNLVGNALKFRSDKKPVVEITAEKVKNEYWKFCIEDNGIGIEPHHIERIFIIFQRLHTKEQYAGTGIGLAISKKIVEFHGGHIWVESQPGTGTSFYFTIPV